MEKMDEALSTTTVTRSDYSSFGRHRKKKTLNMPLHVRCNIPDLIRMKEIFQNARKGKLTAIEFRSILESQFNAEYDDEEFNRMFLKINCARNGEIDWGEFLSHLMLGFHSNDPENERETHVTPIEGLPIIMESQHRNPITRICFSPLVRKDRTKDPMQGNYITVCRDGIINWWSLDFRYLRSGISTGSQLKVSRSWVTDMAVMPDINIIVTSSTERDLRFYDCTAGIFMLKIVIMSWAYMICTMHYHFHTDIEEDSLLICGDMGGNVRILSFSSKDRGPFKSDAGEPVLQLRHADLKKQRNVLPGLRLIELLNIHPDWIRQVSYYESLHCIVSCAACPQALLIRDVLGTKTNNMINVAKGIYCFAFDEDVHVLVTGSTDRIVRTWNPFVPSTPLGIFKGHSAGIVDVVLQDKGHTIYSLSRDHVIKVWDAHAQTCLQTYIDIPQSVTGNVPISSYYNKGTREYLIGGRKLAAITLNELQNPEHSDGRTHTQGVSKILYNPLFKIFITCGVDSRIISWDIITGKRNLTIRDAHTRELVGRDIPVEITAACFDPGYQLLLTGARNGTLKIWNFTIGMCIRCLTIDTACAVTNVFWIEGRILAVGWNRVVIEFDDSDPTCKRGKCWEMRHTDDIIAAAVRTPETIVTGSFNSEMILWKLETGQPYRQFLCADPTLRIRLKHERRESHRASLHKITLHPSLHQHANQSMFNARISTSSSQIFSYEERRSSMDPEALMAKARARRLSSFSFPKMVRGSTHTKDTKHLAVHAMVFLCTRPIAMDVASLFVSLENGIIQCWSDHSAGGCKGHFKAAHKEGEYVSSMTTDDKNEFLITGSTSGYIRVWLMTNFMTNKQVHVSMPKLRLQFPFLWKDRIPGRAKRRTKYQPLPLLLNSYRAHLRSITTVAYLENIENMNLVLSGSSNYSVRIWRLSGEYIRTLGTPIPYSLQDTRYPPDVKKVASSTTLKVLNKGEVSRYFPGQKEVDRHQDITQKELETKTYGSPPEEPILGKHFHLPTQPEWQDRIKLDTSLQKIPIYKHLRMVNTQQIRRPPTPERILKTRLNQASKSPAVTRKPRFEANHKKKRGKS